MSDDTQRHGFDAGEVARSQSAPAAFEPAMAGDVASPLGYDPVAPSGEGLDPSYFLGVLHKRRWLAATAFLLVVAGTAVYTFTTVPLYEARVRLLIEPERINVVKIEDVVAQERSLEGQVAVLQSRWLAKETMLALHLLIESAPAPAVPAISAQDPARQPRASSPAAADRLRGYWSIVVASARDLRERVQPSPAPSVDQASAENAQIDGFLGGLTVAPGAKGVLDLKYRSSDPVLAAGIANGVAQQYINQNVIMRDAALKEVSDWLSARMREQKKKVDASEQALQQFREQNHFTVADGAENPTVAKLNELAAAATRAKTNRFEREAILDKMRTLKADPAAVQRLPQMIADPMVQQARLDLERLQHDRAQMAERLQDRHPDMVKSAAAIQATQQRLQAEMDRVRDAVRDEVASAQTLETSLTATIEQQKQEALEQNRKGVQLSILEREAQSNGQIYEMLMQRARETNITKEIRPTQIRVLDPAVVPRAPLFPKPQQNMLLAFFAGLVMAVALAFALDLLDNRIKTPDEIKSRLGLALLGIVPEVPVVASSGEARKGGPLMINGVPPTFVEAMRSVRTNVLYSFTDQSLKTIVITSASLSEGKTVVASNLAIAMAQAGERVLLVDADMRRPTLHDVFDVEREPGLSNLLVGNARASDAVRRSSVPNLWLLPSGHRPPNPPELLGSQRFRNMLGAFGNYFDWVVIDAPPVMPVTDACVLAHKATGVLFVVGAELVSRQVAQRAIEQLARVNARVVGGILTRVDLKRNAYYYSKYYHPRYDEYASVASQ